MLKLCPYLLPYLTFGVSGLKWCCFGLVSILMWPRLLKSHEVMRFDITLHMLLNLYCAAPPLIKWQYVIIMAQDFPRKWRGISSYSLQAELCGLFCIHVVVKCLLVIERPLSRLTRIRRCVVLIPESWSLLLGPRRNTLTQRQPSVVCQHFGCSIAPPKLCQLQ